MEIKTLGRMIIMTIVLMYIPLSIASAGNDTFVPSFKDGMQDLPSSVKDSISRIINWGQVALVVIVLIYTIFQGICAIIDGKRGDASGRSSHISNVFVGLGILIIVGVVLLLINYVIK